jgi:hypothetical protein
MKKMIRKHENRLARSLAALELETTSPSTGYVNAGAVEGDMEWFLTWRLNLGHYPCRMWCDGVVDLLITPTGRRAYNVQGKAWIGPVSDVSIQSLWELKGTITLNSRLDKLRSYKINIADQQMVLRCMKGHLGVVQRFTR